MATWLVVDDEQSIGWGLRRLGERNGHRVLTASSAEQALELLPGADVDLIVLDVRLPGMDGLTAMEPLRRAAGNVPVVFSPEYENFAAGTLSSQRHSSANVIAALGRGEEASRETVLAIDISVLDAGRLNQRELTRNASGQPNLVALAAYADSVRQQLKAGDSLDFTPLLTNTTVYGVHFWWTDCVTATFQGITQNKRITQVAIKVDQRGETFNQWQFETL